MFEIQHVSKSFPGVRALADVSLCLQAGEIHGLIGENGAGKSTLIKIITGLYRPDTGRLLLQGNELHLASTRAALKAGIGAVHQERNLIPRFTIAENMLLERLPARMGIVQSAALKQEASHWLQKLHLELDPEMEVAQLSMAQAQLVEIAKALTLDSRILLLDEPTASITPAETEHLFRIFRALRDQGVALLFVSHKLEEIFSLCDRLTVLRDGKAVVVNQDIKTRDREQVLTAMIGRAQTIADLPARVVDGTQIVLEGRELRTARGHRHINFALHRGEILGLYGLVGSGRSELARALIGVEADGRQDPGKWPARFSAWGAPGQAKIPHWLCDGESQRGGAAADPGCGHEYSHYRLGALAAFPWLDSQALGRATGWHLCGPAGHQSFLGRATGWHAQWR
jgi:ribose transport system ATP-binding protein